MNTDIYRHGDVLLKRIDKMPKGLKQLNTRILKEGEATGHMHELTSGQVSVYADSKGQKYVQVEQEATLIHPEHNALQIKEGVYMMIEERELNVFANEIKQVTD